MFICYPVNGGGVAMTTLQAKKTKKSNLKRTTIFLTEEHHEALRRIAFEHKVSMANLIREAVLEIIEDDEDIREGLLALQDSDEESITLEEFKHRRSEGQE
jgi:predicted DNA-binding protein